MVLGKMSFKDLDRVFLAFDKKKEIAKLEKELKFESNDGIILGYAYLSHEEGVLIKILGPIYMEDNTYYLDTDMINKETSIPLSKLYKFHATILDKEVVKKISDSYVVEKNIDVFYEKEAILNSRKLESLDAFRHDTYMDDVELVLYTGKKEEYLWGRIEDLSVNGEVLVCQLLENSKYNKKYKKDELVLVKVKREKKTIDLVIDSIVVKKN